MISLTIGAPRNRHGKSVRAGGPPGARWLRRCAIACKLMAKLNFFWCEPAQGDGHFLKAESIAIPQTPWPPPVKLTKRLACAARSSHLPSPRIMHYKSAGDAHPVNAHLCRVVHLETPRELFRTPRWFSAESAKRRLREARPNFYAEELERVVDYAVRCVHADAPQAVSPLN